MPAPKILLIDLETAPNLGWVWGKWEQSVIEFKTNWYILSFSYKWLDGKRITTRILPDYPRWKTNTECDRDLVQDLWKLIDEADIIIAHNGDKFDIRKANARFVAHGLQPPSHYRTIDTLKIARKYFKFDSNRLDDLGKYLRCGRKTAYGGGAQLWLKCMAGHMGSWQTMRTYNAGDVKLLERVYLKLRPWHATHPNLAVYRGTQSCPHCQSDNIKASGYYYTKVGKRAQFQCKDCGGWHTGRGYVREGVTASGRPARTPTALTRR